MTRYNYLGDHAARAKISSLDAFAFKGFASTAGNPLPYGFCFAELSTSILLTQSITRAGPSKAYCKITCENIETPR